MKILTKENIEQAALILRHNGVVAFPTETVYGLGVRADKEEMFERLVKVKNRRPNQPFTVMCSNINQLENFIVIDDLTRKIIENFMPGPITLIAKAKEGVAQYLDLGTGYIGVRIPKNVLVIDLIDKVGVPLLVPSANPTGEVPALTSVDVIHYFGDDSIDAVIDGETKSNIPSTIIKIVDDKIELIREGEISLKTIMEEIK